MKAYTRMVSKGYARFVSSPFDVFVVKAWEFSVTKADGWQEPLFWFCWLVRGHPSMNNYLNRPVEALKMVESEMLRWSTLCRQQGKRTATPGGALLSAGIWPAWFGLDRVEAREQFVHTWGKIRYRPGHGPLEQALQEARRVRLMPSPETMARRAPEDAQDRERCYTFFLSIAGHLQVIVGDRCIELPREKMSKLMNVSKMTISRYVANAIEDGFLVQVKAAVYHPKASPSQRRAAEYRFSVGRFECLKEKSQAGSAESFDRWKSKP